MKRKIALITLSFDAGGAEKIFSRIISNLHADYELTIITFYERGVHLDTIKNLQVKLFSLHAEKGNTINFVIRLRKILRKEKPSAIFSFLYYPNIITSLARLGLPVYHFPSERSNHRVYLTNSIKHKIWKVMLKFSYRKAKKIIALSEVMKNFIAEDFAIPPDKISVIYNGINADELERLASQPVTDVNFSPDIKTIIAVGRHTEAKNYPLLIKAFQLLHNKQKNIQLLIVGSGELQDQTEKLVNDSKLSENIHLLGFRHNPYAYVSKADCFVLSSKWEGFPNALIEAMYINGHVVSTDCPTGPGEIITNKFDGLLCANDDAVALAEVLDEICFNVDLRKSLYLNSRITIKKFDEQLMIEKYKNLIEG
jgi:glycosyltransferase involved in cell wall biosynthesis